MSGMPDHVDDDEPETLPCYRHPDRETALACVTCDRPICPECAVQAAVGFKCPDDARQPRAARAAVPARRLAVGIIAATMTAFVGGSVLAVLRVPFLGIILAYLLGVAVGEVARRASGGYRDPIIARAAAIAAFSGVIALPLLDVLGNLSDLGTRNLGGIAFALLGAIVAAFGAANRANS